MIKLLFTSEPFIFVGMMFFALIGSSVYMIQTFLNRDVESKRTPRSASFGFWIKDNIWRIIMGFLMTFLTLRFLIILIPLFPWIPSFFAQGEGVYAISAGIGYMFDRLGKYTIDKLPILKSENKDDN